MMPIAFATNLKFVKKNSICKAKEEEDAYTRIYFLFFLSFSFLNTSKQLF